MKNNMNAGIYAHSEETNGRTTFVTGIKALDMWIKICWPTATDILKAVLLCTKGFSEAKLDPQGNYHEVMVL